MPIQNVIGDYTAFLDRIFANIQNAGIDVASFEMDHACYRVSNLQQYEIKKAALLQFGDLLTEANVNGRPIATFKLHQALKYKNRDLFLIELPAPKKGKDVADGLEHVEFVVGELIPDIMKKHPGLLWNTSGLEKTLNPELELKFNDGLAIKFHPESLSEVIRKELAMEPS
ncbi:VOC family protein [Bdellovibrio sp. HCB-162]|uniref:VOC family protein n=1 Tax=Bdellovibrio sp. HCB-162 TaxID=3394234 RepID=UPI0039BC2709